MPLVQYFTVLINFSSFFFTLVKIYPITFYNLPFYQRLFVSFPFCCCTDLCRSCLCSSLYVHALLLFISFSFWSHTPLRPLMPLSLRSHPQLHCGYSFAENRLLACFVFPTLSLISLLLRDNFLFFPSFFYHFSSFFRFNITGS